jgi:hypothetical protein
MSWRHVAGAVKDQVAKLRHEVEVEGRTRLDESLAYNLPGGSATPKGLL